MLIVVLLLVQDVEPVSGLPASFILNLGILGDFILIYAWKSQRKVVFGVSVKVFVVVGDVLAKLLFLELPNIQLLLRVRENFNAGRQLDSRLRQPATGVFGDVHYIHSCEVLAHGSTSCNSLDKIWVLIIGGCLAVLFRHRLIFTFTVIVHDYRGSSLSLFRGGLRADGCRFVHSGSFLDGASHVAQAN